MPKTIDDHPTGDQLPIPWATWVPDRLPQFKVHESLGTAKAAVGYIGRHSNPRTRPDGKSEYPVRGGVLYQLVNSRWAVSAVIRPGTYKSDHLIFSAPKKWSQAPGITTLITEHPYL